MDSSSSRSSKEHGFNREKFLLRVISPAIRGQSCPICLKDIVDHRRIAVITGCLHAYCYGCIHRWSDLNRKCPLCNATFDSLFYKISFSSRNFLTEKLPALEKGKSAIHLPQFSSTFPCRPIRRSRSPVRKSRPLPWRRTFGRPGSVPDHVIEARKLQWRASVYKRGLQAVPLSPMNFPEQNASRVGYSKEKVLQRIEPWIKRELQALLEDPDPSIIVHVASSLFIASLEGKSDVRTRKLSAQCDFLSPLQPFLRRWTSMFWHELRCFAETSLNMDTYDAVVEYKRPA